MRHHFSVEEHGPKHLRNSYLSKVILEAFQLHYTVHKVERLGGVSNQKATVTK